MVRWKKKNGLATGTVEERRSGEKLRVKRRVGMKKDPVSTPSGESTNKMEVECIEEKESKAKTEELYRGGIHTSAVETRRSKRSISVRKGRGK